MGNKRKQARIRFHQIRLAQEAQEDEQKAIAAEKRTKKREREGRDGGMDIDELEFASPKRRKLKEVSADEDRMIDIRGPIAAPLRAVDVEIPLIDASTVKNTEIKMFGHSEEDKLQRASLALTKATKDKLELAQDNAQRELFKKEESEAIEANKMQE